MLPCENFGSLFTLDCSRSLSCVNEYLAVDNGGCLCTNNLRALVAAWLPREANMVFA